MKKTEKTTTFIALATIILPFIIQNIGENIMSFISQNWAYIISGTGLLWLIFIMAKVAIRREFISLEFELRDNYNKLKDKLINDGSKRDEQFKLCVFGADFASKFIISQIIAGDYQDDEDGINKLSDFFAKNNISLDYIVSLGLNDEKLIDMIRIKSNQIEIDKIKEKQNLNNRK